MADYTPDTPLVVGNEWVPIKGTPYSLDRSEEIGTSFRLSALTTVVSGAAYGVEDDGIPAQGVMLAVYPKDLVDQTGPIQQVIIQCNGASSSGTASFTSDSTLAGDLASAYDNLSTRMVAAAGNDGTISAHFDTLAHTELSGKRILNVEVLYRIDDVADGISKFLDNSSSIFYYSTNETTDLYGTQFAFNDEIFPPDVDYVGHGIAAISLGNENPYWQGGPSGLFTYPWTWSQLQTLDDAQPAASQAAIKLFVGTVTGGTGISYSIGYLALRVTYCEEQRVLVGGAWSNNWAAGRNLVELRDPTLAGAGLALAAGDYVVTATRFSRGTYLDNSNDMSANAITELYPMVKQIGYRMRTDLPVGQSWVAEETPIMMQLSLHSSTTTVPDVHPYGVQVAAPVWSGATPTQGVLSSSNGAATNYPTVRFYARHAAGTVMPLTVYNSGSATTTATVTVDEFDALPEILDGWKMVDLEFAVPAAFAGAGALSTYAWTSGDTVGNQWQVLSAAAPAVTGSFPRVQLTGAQSLNAATYGGATAFLTWDGAIDLTADATLMFAQDMPAVSGLAVSTLSLEITGIGVECSIPPECIPTGISYNSLTWGGFSASTMPATGFGFYELQRQDTETDWQTILEGGLPAVTGFADYEARVGMAADYRVRFVHRLGFTGPWSSTVSTTIAAPGISGGGSDANVLIFTSNARQDGLRSLAYAMIWESKVDEGFTFVEAKNLVLQQMYGRDFQVAFRPLERGGEEFSRNLLIQAAGVPSGLMQEGFTSLRDLAWDQLPYVCVRDELGDRWLASVNVPDGDVQRRRRLYMATVNIVEVADTAAVIEIPLRTVGGIGGGPGSDVECTPALWDVLPGWDYGCWS